MDGGGDVLSSSNVRSALKLLKSSFERDRLRSADVLHVLPIGA